MEREIKFRAWDAVGKVMLDWLCICQTAFNDERYGLMYRVFTEPSLTPMQYTGLKDKNGAEIYEGDLMDCGSGQHPVVWCDDGYWGVDIDGQDVYSVSDYLRFGGIVVGNIHEGETECKHH